MRLQLTLALIKPDVATDPSRLKLIRTLLIRNNFLIVRTKKLKLDATKAEQFYKTHKDKFFYNRLTTYMTSGTIYAHILARKDAISTWRRLMGPTKVSKAIHESPNTIRGSIGLSDTRNSTHGSDSISTAQNEIQFFFPHFNIIEWYRKDELKFKRKNVIFNQLNFIHKIKRNKFM